MTAGGPNLYTEALVLLGGAVIAAPLFKKIGLGTVLGYLAAGVVIGPLLRLIADGEAILEFAELGVVFLLFIIGLELKPSRLWQMRRDIFGLGTVQVVATGLGADGARHRACRAARRTPRQSSASGSPCRRPPSPCRSSRPTAT